VDYDEWNRRRIPTSREIFGEVDGREGGVQGRAAAALRAADAPRGAVISIVGRLAAQKGVDLFAHGADGILYKDVQMVVLGTGEHWLEDAVRSVAWRQRGKLSAHIAFDNGFAHQIMAGSDMLLVPSKYEPCGLTQMYALRYGTIPVVRSTGGLVDTVQHGVTGFRFDDYTPPSMQWAMGEALGTLPNSARGRSSRRPAWAATTAGTPRPASI
jgi:starch synthase